MPIRSTERSVMSETIDVATWLIFLTEHLSDDTKREEFVARMCARTGMSREDVTKILYAAREALAEHLPAQ